MRYWWSDDNPTRPTPPLLAPYEVNDASGGNLIYLLIALTPEQLNDWLTLLISAAAIRDDVQVIEPLWYAEPATTTEEPEPQEEDILSDVWSDFIDGIVDNSLDGGSFDPVGYVLDEVGAKVQAQTALKTFSVKVLSDVIGAVAVSVGGVVIGTVVVEVGLTEIIAEKIIDGIQEIVLERIA